MITPVVALTLAVPEIGWVTMVTVFGSIAPVLSVSFDKTLICVVALTAKVAESLLATGATFVLSLGALGSVLSLVNRTP